MADSLISARVPKAKRDAVANVLASLGSSTTELVNRAFDYVLAEKKLPEIKAADDCSANNDDFSAFVSRTTFDIPWATDGSVAADTTASDSAANYKDIISAGRQADYERLA